MEPRIQYAQTTHGVSQPCDEAVGGQDLISQACQRGRLTMAPTVKPTMTVWSHPPKYLRDRGEIPLERDARRPPQLLGSAQQTDGGYY